MPNQSPYPNLNLHANSGLTFPWAEVTGKVEGTSDLSFGADGGGVALGMNIYVFWRDLANAIQQILGYSYRDTSRPKSVLRRVLPWQHPIFNQLYAKRITKVTPLQMLGTSEVNRNDLFAPAGGGAGQGQLINTGPWTEYRYARITIAFWRPPYYVRTDSDILDQNGNPQEWLRYVDKHWRLSTQMLTRENATFWWCPSWGTFQSGRTFQGSVGQKVGRLSLTRTWYQIPEAALFGTLVDRTPNGMPTNLYYTQTLTTNPITGYRYPVGMPAPGCVNAPVGGGTVVTPATITNGSPVITLGVSLSQLAVGSGIQMFNGQAPQTGGSSITGIPNGTVVKQVGGGPGTGSSTAIVMSQAAVVNGVYDNKGNLISGGGSAPVFVSVITDGDYTKRMFGCYMGTLLFLGAEFEPVPLQLPAWLMNIPLFSGNEPVSQQQYNVKMMWDVFDPPRSIDQIFTNGPSAPFPNGEPMGHRGHNLMPWSGNGFWYPTRSANDASGSIPPSTLGPFTTPFQYFDPSDLFQIL